MDVTVGVMGLCGAVFVVAFDLEYYIFHSPDEAMLFVMVKAFLYLQNILLFRTLKEFIFSIIRKWMYVQNDSI